MGAACGQCVLHLYGGICPITRCAKKMMNGPCSGSREDRCEVNADRPCAWQLIYKRLKEIGQLDRLKEIKPPKNWRSSGAFSDCAASPWLIPVSGRAKKRTISWLVRAVSI